MPFRTVVIFRALQFTNTKKSVNYNYISKFGDLSFRVFYYSKLVCQIIKKCVLILKRLCSEKTFSVCADPGQTEYEMPLAAPGQRQKKDIKVWQS